MDELFDAQMNSQMDKLNNICMDELIFGWIN